MCPSFEVDDKHDLSVAVLAITVLYFCQVQEEGDCRITKSLKSTNTVQPNDVRRIVASDLRVASKVGSDVNLKRKSPALVKIRGRDVHVATARATLARLSWHHK